MIDINLLRPRDVGEPWLELGKSRQIHDTRRKVSDCASWLSETSQTSVMQTGTLNQRQRCKHCTNSPTTRTIWVQRVRAYFPERHHHLIFQFLLGPIQVAYPPYANEADVLVHQVICENPSPFLSESSHMPTTDVYGSRFVTCPESCKYAMKNRSSFGTDKVAQISGNVSPLHISSFIVAQLFRSPTARILLRTAMTFGPTPARTLPR